MSIRKDSIRPLKDRGILIALVILLAAAAVLNRNFRNIQTYMGILREGSIIAISAIGMTFAVVTGLFDLSVGSMLAFTGMIAVMAVEYLGAVPTLITVCLIGLITGSVNGFLISFLRIPAFIATLAMMFIFRAAAYALTGGSFVQTSLSSFIFWGDGNFIGLPVSFYLMVVLAVVGKFILFNTKYGRHACAIGNSEKAGMISGINKKVVVFIAFALVGFFNSFAAYLMSARLWSANPWMKENYAFDVIAAVVLGGTSMKGGQGSIFNSCVGAVFLASVNTIMNMFHVDSYVQRVVTGIILITAVAVSGVKQIIEQKIVTQALRKEYTGELNAL